MSETEWNYVQFDRTSLAINSGVPKFHNYLYGQSLEMCTNHKPLLGMLAPDRLTPAIISPRLLRCA